MLKCTVAIGAACSFLITAPAHAEQGVERPGIRPVLAAAPPPPERDFERPGFYLIAAGTYALENFEDPEAFSVDDSLGGNARIGYRFSSAFGAEVEWEGLVAFDVDSANSEIDGWALTGNAKLFLPFGRFQPFLLGGLGMMQMRPHGGVLGTKNEEGFALRGGAGFDVYATEHIALTLDASYVWPTSDDIEGLDYVAFSWGFMYRF